MSSAAAAEPACTYGEEEERVPSGRFTRTSIDVRTDSRAGALVLGLMSLGYSRIRWRPRAGGSFTAVDEYGIFAIIVVDVAPLRDGFPVPWLTPARETHMAGICDTYLQDNLRIRKVRADYVAVQVDAPTGGRIAVTQRRGVAWAFADGRPSLHRHDRRG